MRYPNRKALLFYLSIPLVIIVFAFLVMDFVGDKILVPVMEFIAVFDDLPQGLLWVFAIGVIMLFEWKSLAGWPFPDVKGRRAAVDQRGRIEVLADLIQNAHHEVYFRKKLSQYLADLTLSTLAYRRGSTPKIMKERMESGTLDIPSEMSGYFMAGYQKGTPAFKKRIKWSVRAGRADISLKFNPAEVVEFLEQQLEVDHDGRTK